MRNNTLSVLPRASDGAAAASTAGRCSSSSSYAGDPAAAGYAGEAGPAHRDEAAESVDTQLPAYDTASEVQLMAAQVLQRKHPRAPAAPCRAAAAVQDPIHLLRSDPDKNLRARKELLLSAAGTSSIDEGTARVAAVKEELAGVQARLRNALGLRESVSEEIYIEHSYQLPLLKRRSHDTLGITGTDPYSSTHAGKANRLSGPSSAAAGTNVGTKAAALSFAKGAAGTGSSAAAAAAAPSGAAARSRAGGAPETTKIFFDTSSEVAEMAARVLKRAQHAANGQQ